MDRIAPLHELKKIFKADKVNGDNVVFRLHHQVNFFVVLLGITFIFGENYLNGKAIICQNGNAYINQYCWLHGSGHLGSGLSQQVSGCIADQNVFTKSGDKRHTSYYLWLPFILGICLAIIKTPRFFWKHFCERGLMESMVQLDTDSEKLNSKFRKIRGRRSLMYFISFAFCEILNILSVVACMASLNALLDGQYMTYGHAVQEFYANTEEDRKSLKMVNPMCNVFPTEVSCDVASGGISGSADVRNKLCILSNNLFNQYYFLILWIWWVFLLLVSLLGLLNRLLQLCVPGITAAIFRYSLVPHNLEDRANDLAVLKLKQWDYFLLTKMVRNMKGSDIERLLTEMKMTKNNGSLLNQSNL